MALHSFVDNLRIKNRYHQKEGVTLKPQHLIRHLMIEINVLECVVHPKIFKLIRLLIIIFFFFFLVGGKHNLDPWNVGSRNATISSSYECHVLIGHEHNGYKS